MELTSSVFDEGAMIPKKYTCDDMDISPPLKWSNVPEGTKTFAIICDDPDAPMGTWVHWVLFNIPATVNELSQSIPPDKVLKNGARQGINDFVEEKSPVGLKNFNARIIPNNQVTTL